MSEWKSEYQFEYSIGSIEGSELDIGSGKHNSPLCVSPLPSAGDVKHRILTTWSDSKSCVCQFLSANLRAKDYKYQLETKRRPLCTKLHPVAHDQQRETLLAPSQAFSSVGF